MIKKKSLSESKVDIMRKWVPSPESCNAKSRCYAVHIYGKD